MREVDIIITGGTILTLDENDRRIDDGAVAIAGDTIVAVSKSEEILNQFVGKTLMERRFYGEYQDRHYRRLRYG